jgi:hypothetical protein
MERAEKAVTTVLGTAETWALKSANEPERGDAKGRFKEREKISNHLRRAPALGSR